MRIDKEVCRWLVRIDAYNMHIIGNYLVVTACGAINRLIIYNVWRDDDAERKLIWGVGILKESAVTGGENVEDEEHDKIYFIYVYRRFSWCYDDDNMICESFIYSGISTPLRSPVQGIWAETTWSAQNMLRGSYPRRFTGESSTELCNVDHELKSAVA